MLMHLLAENIHYLVQVSSPSAVVNEDEEQKTRFPEYFMTFNELSSLYVRDYHELLS